MDKEKKARLEAGGWRVGSAEEFLGLAPEETAYIELRLKLSDAVREPEEEATDSGSTCRVAPIEPESRSKVEAADESVSLDLLIAHTSRAWSYPSIRGSFLDGENLKAADLEISQE